MSASVDTPTGIRKAAETLEPAPPRPLVRAAVLALTLGQLVLGHAGVLAGALAAAHAAHGHGHALSLLADGGHLDVVLHHDDEETPPGEAPIGFGAHDGDHIVHAASSGGARDGSRRASPLLALACSGPPSAAIDSDPTLARSAPVASLAAATLLRTTVLRI